jgi:hypothetical protein
MKNILVYYLDKQNSSLFVKVLENKMKHLSNEHKTYTPFPVFFLPVSNHMKSNH